MQTDNAQPTPRIGRQRTFAIAICLLVLLILVFVNDQATMSSDTLLSGSAESDWIPSICYRGTTIDSPTLLQECSQYSTIPTHSQPWCISKCGLYTEGLYRTNISHDSLRHLRQTTVRQLRVLASQDRLIPNTSCSSAEVFSDTIDLNSHEMVPNSASDQLPFKLRSNFCKNSFQYVSSIQAVSILHAHSWPSNATSGKGILFTGDSMVRQLFLNLVAIARGEKVITEYQFQGDQIYLVYSDHDVLTTLTGDFRTQNCQLLRRWFGEALIFEVMVKKKTSKKKSFYCPQSPTIQPEPLLIILFLWDVSPNIAIRDVRTRHEPFAFSEVSLHVGGYMYWWFDGTDPQVGIYGEDAFQRAPINVSITPYLERMDTYLRGNPERKYVWITTPFTNMTPTFLRKMGHVPTRNAKMKRWTEQSLFGHENTTNNTEKSTEQRQKWLLDFAGLVDIGNKAGISPRGDGYHFPCTFIPSQPKPVDSIRWNPYHCRDPMNAALVQWLLALLIRL